MPDEQHELPALALALSVLDAAAHAAEAALLRAYPLLEEDPSFDLHAIHHDPHEAAAEIGFVIPSASPYGDTASSPGLSGPLQGSARDVLQVSPRGDSPARTR